MKSIIKKLNILTIITAFSFSQDFFQVEIEGTGVSQLVIFQNSITGLFLGDEIGIFDSEGLLKAVKAIELVEEKAHVANLTDLISDMLGLKSD